MQLKLQKNCIDNALIDDYVRRRIAIMVSTEADDELDEAD